MCHIEWCFRQIKDEKKEIKMKKIIIGLVVLTVVVLTSCGDGTNLTEAEKEQKAKEELFLSELDSLENRLKVDVPERDDLEKAITYFQSYVGFFPEDEKGGDYLLRAADFCFALGDVKKSVKLMNRMIENYPNNKNIQSAYFNRASHTDFELRDTTLAKEYYKVVIEKYPETQSAKDAQTRIDQHFMSMDELFEMFEKMNKDTTVVGV